MVRLKEHDYSWFQAFCCEIKVGGDLPSFEPNDATRIWEGGEVLGESSSMLPPIDLEVSLSRAAHAGKRNRGSSRFFRK
jgi:hypothetical protein